MLMQLCDILRGHGARWGYLKRMAEFHGGAEALTMRRLAAMLRHAGRTVPFYRDRIPPSFAEEDAYHILHGLPLVSRRDINGARESFVSSEPGQHVRETPTGGTSGVPLWVLQDKDYVDWGAAGRHLFFSWLGWRPGDQILRVWGDHAALRRERASLRDRLAARVCRVRTVNGLLLSEENLREYIAVLHRVRAQFLEGYVHGLHRIALEMLKSGIRPPSSLRAVISTAGNLTPDIEDDLRRAFGVVIANRYGCREAGDIAASCPEGRLHVNPFTHYVEILDDRGRLAPKGEGRIVLTLLTNRTMPLIRYDIGDVGDLKERTVCPCGRDWQTFRRVHGREASLLYRADGTIIDPVLFFPFMRILFRLLPVERYQVVQEDYHRFTFRAVLKDGATAEGPETDRGLDEIRQAVRMELGDDVEIAFDFPEEIPFAPSGKYFYALSKVAPPQS
ncbi:MAG TPA: hypothetical protein DIC53_10410 [Synergistaceae bacterium]|nr:hypothetical protein [Synergistaceae bacterium]